MTHSRFLKKQPKRLIIDKGVRDAMFGEKMKTRREELGITQEQVAERLGVSRNTVSRWETGERNAKDETKKKIAALLRTTVADLMNDNDFQPFTVTSDVANQEDTIAKMTSLLRLAVKNKDTMSNNDKQLLKSLLRYGIDEFEDSE